MKMEINKAVELYNQLCNKLDPNVCNVDNFKQIDYGIQFSIFSKEKSGLLRIYQNKKGQIRIDTSQIKDTIILQMVSKVLNIDIPLNENIIPKENSINSTINKISYPMIGTDESGKGDYFGPLVIAGALINESIEKDLTSIGVRDSKKISDHSIFEIAKEIRNILPKQNYSVVIIGPEKYNELYQKMSNLNKLLAWGHARAIENILINTECPNAIADQFGDESFIQKALLEHGKKIKLIQMPKAEQYVSVATASVLAREGFLYRLSLLGREVGIELPKGASISVENASKQIIQKLGKGALNKIAKTHFKTTEKL